MSEKWAKHVSILGEFESAETLWDKVIANKKINGSRPFLILENGTETTIRLFGVFYSASRKYMPFIVKPGLKSFLLTDENKSALVKALYKGDDSAKFQFSQDMKDKLSEFKTVSSELTKLKSSIKSLLNDKWANVLVCNVLDRKKKNVNVFELNSYFLNALQGEYCGLHGGLKTNISGVLARDIICSKTGTGIKSKWKTQLSKQETLLSREEMALLVNNVHDIPQVLKEQSKRSLNTGVGYIYKYENSKPKMPEEVERYLMKESAKFEELQYLNSIEENIDTLPSEAFDDLNEDYDSFSQISIT